MSGVAWPVVAQWVGMVGAFLLGVWWGGRHLKHLGAVIIRQREAIRGYQAALRRNHAGCQAQLNFLEARLALRDTDAAEAELVADIEDYLQRKAGGS